MIALLLITIGNFFSEIATSIGKREIEKKEESVFTMIFLNLIFAVLILGGIAIFREGSFVFSWNSWPTFSARVLLELALSYITVMAIVKSDRSTFGFLRTGTIVFVFVIDFLLGNFLDFWELMGISVVVVALLIIFLNHGISKKGLGWVVASSIIAAVTNSLYKYDITNYNSVVAEQFLTLLIMAIYAFLMAYFVNKEDPILFLRKPIFLVESFSAGLETAIASFAYLFVPASVGTAMSRAVTIMWSLIFGRKLFKEKHIVLKIAVFAVLLVGIIMLAL